MIYVPNKEKLCGERLQKNCVFKKIFESTMNKRYSVIQNIIIW